jgi:hypothetical protein
MPAQAVHVCTEDILHHSHLLRLTMSDGTARTTSIHHDDTYSWQNYVKSIQLNLSVFRSTGLGKLHFSTGPDTSNT